MAGYKDSDLSPKGEGVEDVTEYVGLLEAKLVELEQALAKSKSEGDATELRKVRDLLVRANSEVSELRKKEAALVEIRAEVMALGGLDKLRMQVKEVANLQTALANETENRRRETANLRETEKVLSGTALARDDLQRMYNRAVEERDQFQKAWGKLNPQLEAQEQLLATYRRLEDRRLTEAKEMTMAPKNDSPTEKTLTQKIADSSAIQTLKIDGTEAAWRLAGSQFVKLAKEPIVALLQRHLAPGDDSMRAKIATFLDSELGAGLLAGVLSAGLSAMPTAAGSIQAQLARELRVRSMAATGDVIADVLMGPLRQVAVMYLQAPAPGGPAELGTGDANNVLNFEPAREKVG